MHSPKVSDISFQIFFSKSGKNPAWITLDYECKEMKKKEERKLDDLHTYLILFTVLLRGHSTTT